jgi:hypothetical protein|tara:strand:+ start:132 stop:404 length:273 start_codon:yes stop_codon:yes gene_type:complete
MKNNQYGKSLGMREHLLSGKPITVIEALLFYGIPCVSGHISNLRQEGWIIKSKRIPFAAAIKRVNDYAVLKPPKNLPIREIQLTEYWLSR